MAAIPVSLAYVTKARTSRQAFVFAAMFILGMIVIHVVLGLVAGFGGLGVQKLLDRKWGVLIGPVLIVLGLMWPGWLRIPLPAFAFTVTRQHSSLGAFLLGIPFSISKIGIRAWRERVLTVGWFQVGTINFKKKK